MDAAIYGKRVKRADWKPFERVTYPAVFVWPLQPLGIVKWLFGYPGYILPLNLFYGLLGVAVWLYLTPPLAAMKFFAPGWILFLLARNAVLTLIFYSLFHLPLYVRKSQGKAFKFNGKWLDRDNEAFLFRSQLADNLIWSFASGVTIWTAYEAVTLWAFANG